MVGGRIQEDGNYAVVVSFNYALLLIPLLVLGALLGMILGRNVSAKEPEPTSPAVYEPQQTIETVEPATLLYIKVPGYADCDIDRSRPLLILYNPTDNECLMKYRIYLGDTLVHETEQLLSGERCGFDLYGITVQGSYSVRIEALPCSLDAGTAYNTVSQTIQINVYKE